MQLESLSLFIVDESRAFLAGVGSLMGSKVARLETFTSVKDAFLAMTAVPPDILVTDIEAPDLNGIGLIRKIRAEPLLGAIPILVLTGKDDVLITPFTSPDMAIRAILANPPDLVFLDYRLPGTTGDEVAQKLALAIPVFLVTGDIYVGTKYEFTKIFSKPIDEQEVRSEIKKYKR